MEMLQQKQGYGCGLYSVANALCMPEFATTNRLDESKDGNGIMQLNKWLLDDNNSFQIFPLYYKNGVEFMTPNLKLNVKKYPDIKYYPILITYEVEDCPMNHMIALHYFKDKSVTVLDSGEDKPTVCNSWKSFRKMYPRIISLGIFMDFNNNEIYFKQ
jgi:hypothetical protein